MGGDIRPAETAGEYLLLLFLVCVPFLPALQAAWPIGSAHDAYRQYQVLLLLLAGLLAIPGKKRRPALLAVAPYLPWVLLALGVWVLAAAFQAELRRWALLEWAHYWLLIGLALMVARARVSVGAGFDRWALGLLVTGIGAYAALTLLFYLASLSQPNLVFEEQGLFPAFNNRRFFGHFQTLAFPFLVLVLIQARSIPIRTLLWLLLLWWWLLVFAAGTRGTVLGVGGALVLLAALPGRVGWSWLRLQLLAAVSGWLAYLVLFRWLPAWLGVIEGGDWLPMRILGLSAREVLWHQAVEFTLMHPWFGIGPMHLALYPTGVGAHPHSLPLQWLAEWGIPAAVLALALLLWGLLCLYRSAGATRAPLQLALFAALAGAFIQSLVDGVHVMPYSQILVAIAAGWALALVNPAGGGGEHRHERSLSLALRGLTLVAMLALVAGIAPEIFQLEAWETAYRASHADSLWLPRFWLQGQIDG